MYLLRNAKRTIKSVFSRNSNKIGSLLFLFIVLFICAFSLLSNIIFNALVKNMTFESNKKVISFIDERIKERNKSAQEYCLSMYSNLGYYLNSKIIDEFKLQNLINSLKMEIVSSNIVNSLILYNHNMDRYFSINNDLINFNFKEFDNVPGIEKGSTVMAPMVRRIENHSKSINDRTFLTYVMFENIALDGIPDGAVIVNVDAAKLSDDLKGMEDAKAYILGENSDIIASNQSKWELKLDEKYTPFLDTKGQTIVRNIGKEKSLITCFDIENTNWKLVIIQNYNISFAQLWETRYSIIWLTLVFILLSAMFAVYFSKIAYKPISTLVANIKQSFDNSQYYDDDDIEFLMNIFERKDNMDDNSNLYKRIMSENYFRLKIFGVIPDTLVEDNASDDNWFENKEINIIGGRLCLIVMENCNKLLEESAYSVKTLQGYLYETIKDEMQSGDLNCIFWSKNNEIILIVNTQLDILIDNFNNIKNDICHKHNIELSFYISNPILDSSAINECYMKVSELKKYKIIFDKNYMLMENDIAQNINSPFVYPQKVSGNLVDEIGLGTDMEKLRSLFDEFLTTISCNDVYNYRTALLQLAISFYNLLGKKKFEGQTFDFEDLLHIIMATDDKSILIEKFDKLFDFVVSSSVRYENFSSKPIINAVMDYAQANYRDSSLSLESIAKKYKISDSYLSKIFKNIMGQSLTKYITKIRLEQAIKLMNESNMPIKDILVSVGFENESNFYKLFKKEFGITPKQYKISNNFEVNKI